MTLLRVTDRGLYCEAGDFYVDPWAARGPGGGHPCPRRPRGLGLPRLPDLDARARRPPAPPRPGSADPRGAPTARRSTLNGVRVSLHPAGHILGSAQVRVEHRGRGLGRLRRLQDRARPDLRAVRAGPLPHLRHRIHVRPADLPLAARSRRCSPRSTPGGGRTRTPGKASLLFGYALGKAQRLLAGLDPGDRPDPHPRRGRADDRGLPRRRRRAAADHATSRPPSARTDWQRAHRSSRRRRPRARPGPRKFGAVSTAFASGWMRDPRGAAAAGRRPRLRPLRPRRLARPARARSRPPAPSGSG